jgi:hypothetical protein
MSLALDLYDGPGTLDRGCGSLAQWQEGRLLSTDIDEGRTKTMVDAKDAPEIDVAGPGVVSFALAVKLD